MTPDPYNHFEALYTASLNVMACLSDISSDPAAKAKAVRATDRGRNTPPLHHPRRDQIQAAMAQDAVGYVLFLVGQEALYLPHSALVFAFRAMCMAKLAQQNREKKVGVHEPGVWECGARACDVLCVHVCECVH